ncbi:YhdP family protein [Thiomicrorhabdus sp. Kp2]|uniref:YhdP family phospholipid transporter n=1 Tax=Thiomicrorhabdus sp. Kp2 TaxID=1123518 RepID=UPI0003F4FE2B|nr:AsmA-like C-terminal region-containing protein [Thiomicrorhabdus sp. Kp2]
MIVKSTHHTLHWAFGLFVAYLLITRLFISWVQFFPNQFVATSEWLTDSKIQLGSIEIEQDWLGFQASLKNFSISSDDFEFQAQKLIVDINAFSMLIPTAGYGDFLQITKGAFQSKLNSSLEEESKAFDIQELGRVDTNISHLWKRIKLQDFVLNEVGRPGLSIQLHNFQSLYGSHLSIVSEFSLNYKDVLKYERFNLKSTFTPTVWGGIENGEFSLTSFKPLSIKRLSKLLSVNWQSVLPDGELILDLKGHLSKSQLSSMELNLNTQALKWHQLHKGLPDNLGLKLNWNVEHQNISKKLKDWRFTLSKIQIDNRYIESISPMDLRFEGQEFIRFNADYFDIEPFKVVVKSLIKNPHIASLFDRSAYLSISNLEGIFNWKTLDLPELEILFDRLDIPVTDYPGMSLRQFNVIKTPENIMVSTPNPVWIMEPKVHDKPMKLELPASFTLSLDKVNQVWSLPDSRFLIDKMPFNLKMNQLSSSYIDSEFSMNIDSISRLKNYLPYAFMTDKLKKWLTEGLVGGENITIKGDIRGVLSAFPFQNKDGLFKVVASVKNAALNFNPKWPVLRDFDAELVFTPFNLAIAVDKVNIGTDVIAKDVLVNIPGLDNKDIALTVQGNVQTKLQNAVNYLNASPLSQSLGIKEFLTKGGKLSGQSTVHVDKIWVPISGYKDRAVKVSGYVIFNRAKLNILEKLHLTDIKGRLDFSEQGVSSQRLGFKLLDGDGQVQVKTNKLTKQTDITGSGRFFEKEHDWFNKAVPWSARIVVPFKASKNKDVTLDLDVDLAQAESKLPTPLDKESLASKKATISTKISGESIKSELKLPGLVKANLLWEKHKAGFELTNNKIWLGQVPVKKEDTLNKYSFVKGNIQKLSLDEWMPISKKIDFLSPSSKDNSSSLDWSSSSVFVKQAKFLSHDYSNLRFTWKSKANEPLIVNVLNQDIDAAVQFTKADLIDVKVKKFSFYTDDMANTTDKAVASQKNNCIIDDKEPLLPIIQFKGQNLIIDERKVDSVSFKLVDDMDNLQIENIQGSFGGGAGTLIGGYIFDKQTGKSAFNIQLNSQNVSAVTEFIKLKKGFTGKSGRVDIRLTWLGGLECFSTKRTEGNIKFKLEDGSIEDIEPGFARLIGLLSIESLVRRLKLDLKDVTNKGMVYDEIKGEANLKDGIVLIDNFTIKAPSANGVIKGNANISKQSFDLDASITPKIGATVPTIAALAGTANPLAALAVYTLMKVLPGVNENLVTYKYKITGPWSSPTIDGDKNEAPKKENIESDSILELN